MSWPPNGIVAGSTTLLILSVKSNAYTVHNMVFAIFSLFSIGYQKNSVHNSGQISSLKLGSYGSLTK
jgi:hypothetical protein